MDDAMTDEEFEKKLHHQFPCECWPDNSSNKRWTHEKYSVEILGVAIGYKIVWPASINLVELSQSKTLERAKPGTKWSRDQKKKNSREN